MKKKIIVESNLDDDLEDFLNRIGKIVEKKQAKKYSKITKESSGFQLVQVVIPKVNTTKDDITLEEYEVTTVDLGPTTKEQEIEEFDESVKVIK